MYNFFGRQLICGERLNSTPVSRDLSRSSSEQYITCHANETVWSDTFDQTSPLALATARNLRAITDPHIPLSLLRARSLGADIHLWCS